MLKNYITTFLPKNTNFNRVYNLINKTNFRFGIKFPKVTRVRCVLHDIRTNCTHWIK